jgi:hypothetical protein
MAARHTSGMDPSHRDATADRVAQIASLLKVAGGELIRDPIVAASVARFAARLRDGALNNLARGMRRVAHRHPAVVVIGAVALGLACARLLRASQSDDVLDGEWEPADAGAIVPKANLTSVPPSRQSRGD